MLSEYGQNWRSLKPCLIHHRRVKRFLGIIPLISVEFSSMDLKRGLKWHDLMFYG